jgi:hypothetical protein
MLRLLFVHDMFRLTQPLAPNIVNTAEGTRILNSNINFIGFEVLTAVIVKSSVCWDVTPCFVVC